MMIGKGEWESLSPSRAVFRTLFRVWGVVGRSVGDLNDETDVTFPLCVHYPDIYISDGRISLLLFLFSALKVVSFNMSSVLELLQLFL